MSDDVATTDLLVAKALPEDLRMYGVTTILGALDKPALVYWAATETAKAAIKAANSLPTRIKEDGEEETLKWLTGARFRSAPNQRSAKELGTAVHKALEELALTGKFPKVDDELLPFIQQAAKWMQKFQPTFEASEMTVYNETFGYAGTLDSIMVIDGVRFLVDFKTTRKSVDSRGNETTPYPEQVGIQLAAYRYAEFAATWRPRRFEYQKRRYYLLGMDERASSVPVPEVDACLVLHITPDHCEGFPINANKAAFDAFLYSLECFRWVNDTSRHIMGDPLQKEN